MSGLPAPVSVRDPSRAGVRSRLHEAVLHQLDVAGLIGITRVVLDTPLPGWAEGGGWSRAT
ncbi:hypothetical protein CFC35_07580 [Streptomyces sp. FBKL.4005]|nr:hypothetical protein CFC35_07580 [Streptomyces sp. FBKL.4005]